MPSLNGDCLPFEMADQCLLFGGEVMRINGKIALGLSGLIYTVVSIPSHAAETVTHEYDALGRLKKTTKTGGPTAGQQTTTAYDPAGNRTNQTTGGVNGVPAPPPPPPSPPPPPPP
jgi:YD repeat-containing protein